ncbi:MAG: Crp/Fnr family transcriptional regulator [Ignavibacterium sp.]
MVHNYNEILRLVPIFSELDDEIIEELASLGRIKEYDKDVIIFLENETGNAMFIIIEGKVKVSRISDDGREVILSILDEADFFGEMALLDGQARSANIISIEKSKLFIIQRKDFLDLLAQHPNVSVSLLQELTKRIRIADMKIKSLSLKDAEGKVASVILQLADDMGKIRHGAVEIERLPLQQDLANMAGTSRETISRVMNTFKKKGFIELDGNKLKIMDYTKFKELFE